MKFPYNSRLNLLRSGVLVLVAGFFLAIVVASALATDRVSAIIAQPHPPAGVVFEIVSEDDDHLAWAIPYVTAEIKRLRDRFPGLNIAIVSHGLEQFVMTTSERDENGAVHMAIKDLVTQQHVPFQVCGSFAKRYGIEAGMFAEYVDVVPAAPAQLRQYLQQGYEQILVEKRDT